MKQTIISILTLSIASIAILSINNDNNNSVSALTYSDNVGVNFTFSPSLTVSLSSSDIVINDLTPGSSSDSNIITINVLSNNQNGYELKSTVGNNTTYDTRNLVHSNTTNNNNNNSNSNSNNSSSNAIFSSIDYTTTPTITNPSDFDNNEWGYSYSTDNSTWSNYNGLPLYSDTTNVSTLRTNTGPSASSGDNTYFKIAAKAAVSQTNGEYNNVINFTVVGNTNPVSFYDAFTEAAATDPSITQLNGYYKMQDMTSTICNNVHTSELADNSDTMEAQLIDIRDHNVYWVAKLKDGHCWMTQNLDLNLDKDVALTSEDTDLREAGVNGYVDGYTTKDGVIYWTPERSTIDGETRIVGWVGDDNNPYSVDTGKYYEDGTWFPATACKYAAGGTCTTYFSKTPYATNGTHGSVGNYYNWSSAIASNDSAEWATSTLSDPVGLDPENSICSMGWRLPHKSTSEAAGGLTYNEIPSLNPIYNTDRYGSGEQQDLGLFSFPVYFVRGGTIWGAGLSGPGESGYLLSSTVYSSNTVYVARYGGNYVPLNDFHARNYGWSVRCLAR